MLRRGVFSRCRLLRRTPLRQSSVMNPPEERENRRPGKPLLHTGPSPATTCPVWERGRPCPAGCRESAVRSTKPCLFPPGRPSRSMRACGPPLGAWQSATYSGGVTPSTPSSRPVSRASLPPATRTGLAWTVMTRFLSARRGARYLFQGLREGKSPLILVGLIVLVARFNRRWRPYRSRVTTVRVRPGQTVGLRVSRPGEAPATFRVDS